MSGAGTAEPPPVTLVTGPEELLRDRAVAAAVRVAKQIDPAAQVVDLTGQDMAPGELTGHANPSLFGDLTIILVRDPQDATNDVSDEIKRYLAEPAPRVTLVLVHPGGVKGKALLDTARKVPAAAVIECKQLKWDSDKEQFVQAEFVSAGRTITPGAVQALVDAVGSDLRGLAGACAQLMADTAGNVERSSVDRYHAGRIEVSGFRVADAALEGRSREALRLLRHALATGADPVPVNAALAAGLRSMARVSGTSRTARVDEVARELGLKPFVVRKARAQLAGWSPDAVTRAVAAVAFADEQIKGGGADAVYALERAIITIGRVRGG